MPRARLAFALAVAVVIFLAGTWLLRAPRPPALPEDPPRVPGARCCAAGERLRPDDLETLAAEVNRLWIGGAPSSAAIPARLRAPAVAVYAAVRARGARLAHGWETRGTARDALAALLRRLRAGLGETKARTVDRIELDFTHAWQELDPRDPRERRMLVANVRRGIDGLEIDRDGIVSRTAPTTSVATNRGHGRLLELFARRHDVSPDRLEREARVWRFEADQVLVRPGERPTAILLFRGNELVPVEAVTEPRVRRAGELAALWLTSNLDDDGRLAYAFWPSAGRESPSNNMIRQWMATVALGRVASARADEALHERVGKNIDYNLGRFYREEDGHGLIEWKGKVKLGAVALAALAIVEHPRRAKWAREEAALRRTVDALWNADGSFRTFWRPAGRNDNQNFYPGEALLLWATLYERERDPRRLERFRASFRHYRAWHLEPRRRNPAFVPWHTQADYAMWRLTGDEELRDFIFAMNDWLLGVQEWSRDPVWPDTQGRFYDPGRPFGPPHASATGVYLEGLADAFALARETGDERRAEAYRVAIVRGLRSVLQLQFDDDVDLFYVPDRLRRRVRGGIRTTVYDNRIRCDNVQHNLMAILKILDRFRPEDYRHAPAAP